MDSVTLTVKKITADDWSIQNAKIAVLDFGKKSQQFSLLSASLILPAPFNDFSSLDIRCEQFSWDDNYLNCQKGKGRLGSNKFSQFTFDFSFKVQDQQTTIKISRLPLLGGKIALYAREMKGKWFLQIKAKRLHLVELKKILDLASLKSVKGRADIELELIGVEGNIQQLLATALVNKISIQDHQGKLASEDLTVQSELTLNSKKGGWQWFSKNRFLEGGLYIDPIFWEINNKQVIDLDASGIWQSGQKILSVDKVKLDHSNIGLLQGSGRINYIKGVNFEAVELLARIPKLQPAVPVYLTPFLETGPFEGIDLAGKMNAKLTVKQNVITDLTVDFEDLKLDDADQRFHLNHANGHVYWNKQTDDFQASFINWQQLKVKAIPFAPGRLDFAVFGKQFKLIKTADLAVLGGSLSIDQFSFASVKNDDADVHFKGGVKNLSLSQLSEAFKWTPLSGKITGYIPSVRYQNKKLDLDGELKLQVFDGEVTIKKLASSGMFTDFARFYTDVEFDNLDLNAITQKFQIGNIEGRLSGFAQDVYLENWQPVSFYAWLGTPEDDDSNHRISQKAVENIASIGGGGAADVISKGFLRFFDTFGYDKLGFGCYLYQGVCQLMGVKAAENGFYLIKGGGLPRIDVIGYNPRLDWDVLVQRLKRIATTDEVVID